MLENIINLATSDRVRKQAYRWFPFMLQHLDAWPFGGDMHQQRHWSRTLILAGAIADMCGMPDADLETLCTAAAFHDARRASAWPDVGHGQRAASYYREWCDQHSWEFDERAYLAIAWHDQDDEQGKRVFMEYDAQHPGANALPIWAAFKDADGLDRIRLDESAFDPSYLRTPGAEALVEYAGKLLHASALPGVFCAPEKPAAPQDYLVVVDVQNDFVDGALGTAEAVAALPAMVQRVRSFEGQVIFTKDTHDTDYAHTQEGAKLPVPHCLCGTPGWQLAPAMDALRKELDAPVILKGTFGSTELPGDLEALYARGLVKSVEFIGLCTDICVVSNAMLVKAHLPQLPVAVTAAACAGVTPANHEAALATMASCQIEIR